MNYTLRLLDPMQVLGENSFIFSSTAVTVGEDEMSIKADCSSYASQITYVTDRPGHDRRYAIDARKLEAELGWKPAETFDTGIRKTVEWYLANPEWVQHVQSGAYREWVNKQYA